MDGCGGCGSRGEFGAVFSARDEAEALDDVGDVHGDTAHVEDQGGAVEEHVRFRGPVEFCDETGQTEEDDDVEDPRDQRRRGVEEAQVGFEVVVVAGGCRGRGPEEGIVVGEEGEDDAEEEACCYVSLRVSLCFLGLWVSR